VQTVLMNMRDSSSQYLGIMCKMDGLYTGLKTYKIERQ